MKTNKKILGTSLLVTCLTTTSLFAQAKNFQGFSLALGASATSGKSELEGKLYSSEQTSASFDKSNIIPSVDLSNAIQSTDKFFISLGISRDFKKTNLGQQYFDQSEDNTTLENKLKSHYAMYVQPSYLISNTSAIFGKISYNKAKIESAATGEFGTDTTEVQSKSTHGYGYGLGIKTLINSNFYIQVEAERVNYKSKSFDPDSSSVPGGFQADYTLKPSTNSGKISVGYKF